MLRYFHDEIVSRRLQAFGGGLGHARSVLRKRDAFNHENEVRLISVGSKFSKHERSRLCLK